YDRETDSLIISLREAPIRESDEVRPEVIADFGENGGVVRFDVLRTPRWSRTPSECNSRRPAEGDFSGLVLISEWWLYSRSSSSTPCAIRQADEGATV